MGWGTADLWVMGWGTADLWVMVCISLPTELVDGRGYGLKGVMGYQKYGLRGVQLYMSQGCAENLEKTTLVSM